MRTDLLSVNLTTRESHALTVSVSQYYYSGKVSRVIGGLINSYRSPNCVSKIYISWKGFRDRAAGPGPKLATAVEKEKHRRGAGLRGQIGYMYA